MNLIDAIKSGKPFRRSGQGEWKTKWFLESTLRQAKIEGLDLRRLQMLEESVKKVVEVSLDDLLADDWEIQEPTVTITRSQFNSAHEKASNQFFGIDDVISGRGHKEALWELLSQGSSD